MSLTSRVVFSFPLERAVEDEWHAMKCEFREKCQQINACWKNNSTKVPRRSLEYVCLGTSLSPSEDIVGLQLLGLLECAPVVLTHSLLLASRLSRAAQVLRDHEEIEESPATL